jgi:hypothetical protein
MSPSVDSLRTCVVSSCSVFLCFFMARSAPIFVMPCKRVVKLLLHASVLRAGLSFFASGQFFLYSAAFFVINVIIDYALSINLFLMLCSISLYSVNIFLFLGLRFFPFCLVASTAFSCKFFYLLYSVNIWILYSVLWFQFSVINVALLAHID